MGVDKSILMRKTFLVVCGLFLYCISGCSSPHYPAYPQMALAEYNSHTEYHGLSVAAKALTTPKEIKKYFGTDLLKDGILPLHIVVVNNSGKDSYILLKDNVGLMESSKISSSDRLQVGHDAENLHDIGLMLASTVLSSYGDTQAIGQKENFALKEFQRESIEPGQRASGFIYFRRPNADVNDLSLRITLLQPLTGQKITVNLKLQGD